MFKILLVEDNEMNRDMLMRRLQRNGYEVVIAVDGEEAVRMAQSAVSALKVLLKPTSGASSPMSDDKDQVTLRLVVMPPLSSMAKKVNVSPAVSVLVVTIVPSGPSILSSPASGAWGARGRDTATFSPRGSQAGRAREAPEASGSRT